jgi:hypothetical protein
MRTRPSLSKVEVWEIRAQQNNPRRVSIPSKTVRTKIMQRNFRAIRQIRGPAVWI